MSLKYYFNLLLKRLWLIILLPIIAAVSTFYFIQTTYEPVYESSATLLVINTPMGIRNNETYSDIIAGQQIVKEYKEILLSRTVMKSVMVACNLDNLSYSSFSKSISVSLKTETRILQIKVKDPDPKKSALLTNTLSDVFIQRVSEMMKNHNVVIIDPAETPLYPIHSDVAKNTILAFIIALMFAIALIFIFDELDDTVRTKRDIEEELGLEVLGTIPILNIK